MKDKILILFLILIALPTVSSLFRAGYFPMHDDIQAMRLLQLEKCFSDGQFPCRWVPDMGYGYGYPQFNFYGPTPYYLMYLFKFIGLSILGSVKAFVVLSTIIGVIGLYLLGSSLWGRIGGLIGGIVYLYAPYRANDIYVRGAMGELFALSIAPFLFLYVKKVIERKKYSTFWLAFFYASLLTSHNISTLILTPVLALWAALLVLANRELVRNYLKNFYMVFLGLFWGFLMSAYFFLPAYFEKKYVHVETLLLGYFDYRRHFVSLRQLLLNTYWGYGSSELGVYDGLYLGVGLLLWILPLISLGLVLYFKFTKKYIKRIYYLVYFVIIGWVGLFMTHLKSQFIWEKLSLLHFIQFPWRFIFVATLAFSVAIGAFNLVLKTRKSQFYAVFVFIAIFSFMYGFYFQPKEWFDIDDSRKFSGDNWRLAQTISIYDYLPVYAKHPPGEPAPNMPQVVVGDAEVVDYKKGTDWSYAKVRVDSERAVVREPNYYFPGWKAFVDNKETFISFSNELGLITYELPHGEHLVSMRLEDTPIRSLGNFLSVFALAMIPIYIIYLRKFEL